MTEQTPPFTTSPRALRLWITAASATLFLIVATVVFLLLLPDIGRWTAAIASSLAAVFVSGLGGIALWRDAHRAPPK
jgi:cell division protein FtsW (lipid II flippase)